MNAQILASSNGSSQVSASGLHRCEWMSAYPGAKTSPKLFVTSYVLAPGAPLTRPVEGQDGIIVGVNSGYLLNEKIPEKGHINITKGAVVLMPKETPFLLRNAGDKDLELLLIEIRK
jgi:hypothetical protein